MKTKWMGKGLLIAFASLLAAASGHRSADAAWMVMNHYTNGHINTSARCLVAPSTPGNRLVVKGFRITRSGTTDVSIKLISNESEDPAGSVRDLSSCAFPGCKPIYTLEGVRDGVLYEARNLNIILPADARLYYFGDSAPANTNVTIELWYSEE